MSGVQKRNEWLDVAKGIAIMLVVVGHSASFDVSPIYWFHMPAFFMISGYFFKPLDNLPSIKGWIIKRARQLFIPYLFFLVLISIIRYLFLFYQSELTLNGLLEDMGSVVVGGRFFPSDFYVVMWFIPCLFFTQVLCVLLYYFFKENMIRFVMISFFYTLAHLETWFTMDHNIFVPWNLDVALLALPYYVVGYTISKLFITYKNKFDSLKLLIMSMIAAAGLIYVINSPVSYIFDMRSVTYNHFILDLFTPITLSILLFIICGLITKVRSLSLLLNNIGKSSLIIMYTHVPIKIIYEELFEPNNLMIVLSGILIPLLISKILLENNTALSFLVLGKERKGIAL